MHRRKVFMSVLKTFFYEKGYPDVKSLIDEIIDISSKAINIPFKLYLFGSFANDKASQYSDIDIAIETEGLLKDEDFISLKEKVDDLKTLRKIDIVYLNKSIGLKNVVKKEGILIYESKR